MCYSGFGNKQDFNLTDRSCGHEVYGLLNHQGDCFSDLIEIHTIELKKTEGFSPELAEWIEFLNAKEEADLDSLRMRTQNTGILEAIDELRRFGLIGNSAEEAMEALDIPEADRAGYREHLSTLSSGSADNP